MEKLFFGPPIRHKVDSKGRVSIPAEFRKLLGSNIFYAKYVNEYLIRCCPEDTYKLKEIEMCKKSEDDKERHLFFLLKKYNIDGNGRILLKGPMSKLEEVIFAANGNVFDIYNPKKFPHKNYITL